jgi:hypothetical protein
MNLLPEAALGYARRGWRAFPLHGIVNDACTCARGDCSSPGKHPLVRRGLYEATTEPHVIREWWRRWRSANVGIATGAESGIAVIDVDLPVALGSLDRLVPMLPKTLVGLTGGGGFHLIYRRAAELRCTSARLPGLPGHLPGIDLRADGGYIVAPPSLHISGEHYSWLDLGREVADTPAWLRESPLAARTQLPAEPPRFRAGDGTAYGLSALRDEVDQVTRSRPGTRNHTLNRAAFNLGRLIAGGELDASTCRAALLEAASTCGLGETEASRTVTSGVRAGLRYPRSARGLPQLVRA